jgi:hypothetical protein
MKIPTQQGKYRLGPFNVLIFLKDRFSQSNAPEIYQLKQSIYVLK